MSGAAVAAYLRTLRTTLPRRVAHDADDLPAENARLRAAIGATNARLDAVLAALRKRLRSPSASATLPHPKRRR